MNIFQLLDNLYTNKTTGWILEIEEAEVEPVVIQLFLVMNDAMRVQVRWLDKYVFTLPPKMYLSLAWSVLPKFPKMPFSKYIKKAEEDEEFEFILKQIRKEFRLADNDLKAMRSRILAIVKDDMQGWFKYYGIQKVYWKKYNLNFGYMKESDIPEVQQRKSLASWGL